MLSAGRFHEQSGRVSLCTDLLWEQRMPAEWGPSTSVPQPQWVSCHVGRGQQGGEREMGSGHQNPEAAETPPIPGGPGGGGCGISVWAEGAGSPCMLHFNVGLQHESETEHKLKNFRMVICKHEGPPHPGSSPDLKWGLKKPSIGLGKWQGSNIKW